MKNSFLNGLVQNKIFLIVIAMSIVLALGSVAFMSLSGSAHPAFSDATEITPKASEIPDISPSTQEPYDAVPTQTIEEVTIEVESPKVEITNASDPFPIITNTTCLPDKTDFTVASVVDALDSDRLSVSIEGERYNVKFLGVETHSPNVEVNELVLSANQILVGKTVALVPDGFDADEDGNLLRYVFTEDTFINLALLESGLAVVADNSPIEACLSVFEETQALAKRQEAGLWERLKPEDWREWPVIPEISENALDIYLAGLKTGTNPKLFSIVGDCQNIPGGSLFRKVNWDDFTLPPELEYLESTVKHFRSIWSREPITVDGGFIPASMFSTYWTDTEQCNPIETPLECEFRLNNASIVLVGIGSDQKPGTGDDFDHYMRKIVEYIIGKGALPIIATDAYPTEEGFPLNQVAAQIAYEYDIPLWNFWAAVQDLTNQGLKDDNFHISAEAFAVRRLTGIQVLHAVLEAAQQ
jgi:endonuclease YncB( thermonuclease family)